MARQSEFATQAQSRSKVQVANTGDVQISTVTSQNLSLPERRNHVNPNGHPPRRYSVSSSISTANMGQDCHILRLANEQLLTILDFLEDDPDKTIKFDKRAYLSQESFRPPPRPSATRAQDLRNWRLTCRRFSEVGAEHQFSRVTIRWSVGEFERLEKIANRPHLANAVRKFSYLVPYFFVDGRDRVREVLPSLTASQGRLDVEVFITKVDEQKRIIESKKDQSALNAALKAFKRLQHVQILPVRDRQDEALQSWISNNRNVAEYVQLNWGLACSHSMLTVGEAMLASHSPCQRFSSPHMIPQSAIKLAQPGTFASFVARLSSIELHFDDGTEHLDVRMRELSPLLRAVFHQSAHNLEQVHLGFPSYQPLSLQLDDIFHGVKWEKLLCFGIQSWKLDGDDIINLVSRHRRTLIGLRLRDVLLKDGSRWKDVLPKLRVLHLNWCSLRRIGYAATFDEQWANQGAEIPDDPPGVTSDSSDEDEVEIDEHQVDDGDDTSEQPDAAHQPGGTAGPANANGHLPGSDYAASTTSDAYESDGDSTAGSVASNNTEPDAVVQGNQMGFPNLPRPDTPVSVCSCNNDMPIDLEHAGAYSDNGIEVPNKTRKMWEKWVIGRCLLHDQDTSVPDRAGP